MRFNRMLLIAALITTVTAITGCATVEKTVPPLPKDGNPIPFEDIVKRIRTHAGNATEQFYRDDWESLRATAQQIEQTAGYLPKASEIPDKWKDAVQAESVGFIAEARQLEESAQKSDAKRIITTISDIQLRTRRLSAGK